MKELNNDSIDLDVFVGINVDKSFRKIIGGGIMHQIY